MKLKIEIAVRLRLENLDPLINPKFRFFKKSKYKIRIQVSCYSYTYSYTIYKFKTSYNTTNFCKGHVPMVQYSTIYIVIVR